MTASTCCMSAAISDAATELGAAWVAGGADWTWGWEDTAASIGRGPPAPYRACCRARLALPPRTGLVRQVALL
jgi:hypothetical protein